MNWEPKEQKKKKKTKQNKQKKRTRRKEMKRKKNKWIILQGFVEGWEFIQIRVLRKDTKILKVDS